MRRLFLDANVLVAVLNSEYPLFTHAARIVSLADHPDFEVYTSPLCLAIAFYFAEKKTSSKAAKQKIKVLTEHLKIAENSSAGICSTLNNPKISDFEDGLEYYAAVESQCDYIITEDQKDFYFSELKVLSCKQFFEHYLRKKL